MRVLVCLPVFVILAGCPPSGGMTGATEGTSSGGGESTGGTTGGTTGPTSSGSSGGGECEPGAIEECYSGPPGTVDVGMCAAGTRTCGEDASWGGCVDEVLPAVAEDCAAAGDEDCDGVEGCVVSYPWSRTFGTDQWEETRGVEFDGAGNVVVMVHASGVSTLDFGGGPLMGAGGSDLALAKFAPDGTLLWSRRFAMPYPDFIEPRDLAVAPDGRIAVAAHFSGTVDFGGGPVVAEHVTDGIVAVFEADGSDRYSVLIGNGGSYLYTTAVALDAMGGVSVCGYVFDGYVDLGGKFIDGEGASDDLFVGRFDGSGVYVWGERVTQPGTQLCLALAADADGTTYAAGYFEKWMLIGEKHFSSEDLYDAFAIAIGPSGTPKWHRQWGGLGNDSLRSLALDGQGRLLVAGVAHTGIDFGGGPLATEAPGGASYLAVLTTAEAQHQWSRFVDTGAAAIKGASFDGTGAVVIAGTFREVADFGGEPLVDAGGGDIFAVKLTPGGQHAWSRRFGGTAEELPLAIAGSSEGVVAIAGSHYGAVDFGDGEHPDAGEFGQGFLAVIGP